jgi:uncharacterized protein DUF3592
MDSTDLQLFLYAGLVLVVAGRWFWKRTQVRKTAGWPIVEATIETGDFEVVARTRGAAVRLPVLAFSYEISGERYSGRFALLPYITDPGASIVARMTGRKLPVRYDPEHPEKWYIPDKLMEGCKVEQKMDPHFLDLYPSD